MARIILALVVFFSSATSLWAQGNDFSPGAPTWGQVPWLPPGSIPPPGNSDWSSGEVAHQTLWGVRRGDTIVFDAVLNGWGWGALYLSPMCNDCLNMRYMPPTDGSASPQEQWWHGQLGYWCLRCEWRAEAGQDNPTIWYSYTGQRYSWFDAYLEWKYTIAVPAQRQVVPQEKKDAAHAKAARQEQWAAGLGVLAAGVCGFVPWEVCVAIAAMSGAFQLDAARLRAVDPWDWDYCTPYEGTFNWYVVPWFGYMPEDGSAGPWGMAPYINSYMYHATIIDGLHDMIYVSTNRSNSAWLAGDYGCSDMQYWRANWAIWAAGWHYSNGIAPNLWAFAWFFANYWDPWVDLGSGGDYLSNEVTRMAESYNELGWYFQQ